MTVNLKPLADTAKVILQQLKDFAKEYGEKVLQDVKDGKLSIPSIGGNPNIAKADIETVKLEFLTKDKLVDTLKKGKVKESTEVAALLRKGKTKVYLYTAYLKDSELMPVETNKYFIFISDAIARDLEAMFDGNELVVLR